MIKGLTEGRTKPRSKEPPKKGDHRVDIVKNYMKQLKRNRSGASPSEPDQTRKLLHHILSKRTKRQKKEESPSPQPQSARFPKLDGV